MPRNDESSARAENDPLDLVTYPEAAELIGVSIRTLQRWVRERRIPHIQLPQRGAWAGVRFSRRQLQHWLERHTIKAR